MEFLFYDYKIEVEFTYKPKNRHCYLRYYDNKLHITHFKKLNENDILKLMEKNKTFILKMLNQKGEREKVLHLFGKKYNLEIVETVYDEVRIEDESILIYTKKNNDTYNKKLVDKFYIKNLEDYIRIRFKDICMEFSDILKKEPVLKFKSAITFYGKCDFKNYIVTFSSICAKYDLIYIDSVIYHELTHFKVHNHQKEFYLYYESKFKNAKKIQSQLKRLKYNDYY